MTDALPATPTTVRGEEDIAILQIFERRAGVGAGDLRIELPIPRDHLSALARGRQYPYKGRPNYSFLVEGKPLEVQAVKNRGGEDAAPSLPEDDESRLLVVRKEQLRLDIGRYQAELAALHAQHDRVVASHGRDLDRLTALFGQEAERLKKERDRVDAAVAAYNDELEAKRAEVAKLHESLLALAELDAELTTSLQHRISTADTDLQDRIEQQKKNDKAVQERLNAVHQEGKKRMGEQVLEYVKASAPSETVSGLLNLALTKIANKTGLTDLLSDKAPAKKG